jgi:hypothetical protein
VDAADPLGRPLPRAEVEREYRAAQGVHLVRRTAGEPPSRAYLEMIR